MLGTAGTRSRIYLYKGDTVQEGITITLSSLADWETIADICDADICADSDVMLSQSASINGTEFKTDSVLLWLMEDDPTFLWVKSVIVVEHEKILLCNEVKTLAFDTHLRAFIVEKKSTSRFVKPRQLVYPWPQVCFNYHGDTYVSLQNMDDTWGL